MSYYYSNWNKNNRNNKPQIEKFLTSLFKGLKDKATEFKKEKWSWRKATKWGLYLAGAFLLLGSITFAIVSLSLPDPNKLNSRIIPQSTKIYARDGTTLLYEIHGEAKRTLVELSDIPDYAEHATIAIEDKDFYKNNGINFKGIFRAIFSNVTSGNLTGQGGSTITQQFVKNAILTREKTLTRKIKEAVLSIEIEQRYTKDEILKLYLNEIPYGQNAYGIEAAAQTYFGKHARDITLAEAAYLAALPQRPSYYSPNGPNLDRLEARKNLVLDLMLDQKYITEEQRDQAKNEKVAFSKVKDSILAPHFVLYVQQLLADKYGEKALEEGGLNVVTTLDYKMQEIADKAVKDGVARNEKVNKAENASLVAIDPKTGQILAMVGSRDYFDDEHDGQVNVALRDRQPGSSVKPYVYATAFKQGMSPATMLVDVKTNFGTYGDNQSYSPSNYNGVSNGPLSMRKALAGSLNVPAVKTLALAGVQNAIDTMKDMGITSDINTTRCGLSLVLGGCEITLLDHTSAMGVFAAGGTLHEHTPILKITDPDGRTLEEYEENPGREVLDPQVAYEIVNIMTDNDARSFVFGSNSPLILPDRVVGAKTGTTQAWKDGWTVGYTPSLVAGVWTGNNDSSEMRQGADGVITAAPIWHQFMVEALKGTPAEQFTEPSGIQHVFVDSLSGKLPNEYSPSTKSEIFASFAVPQDYDDVHVGVKVNIQNGKLATDETDEEDIETQVFTVLHSERPEDPNWEDPVRAWAEAAGYGYPPTELDDGSVNPDGETSTRVSFITPINNQQINSFPITVQLQVSGGKKPQEVELYLEGKLIGTKSNAPYSFTVPNAEEGWQTLHAVVKMKSGDELENSIRIFVGDGISILPNNLFKLSKKNNKQWTSI